MKRYWIMETPPQWEKETGVRSGVWCIAADWDSENIPRGWEIGVAVIRAVPEQGEALDIGYAEVKMSPDEKPRIVGDIVWRVFVHNYPVEHGWDNLAENLIRSLAPAGGTGCDEDVEAAFTDFIRTHSGDAECDARPWALAAGVCADLSATRKARSINGKVLAVLQDGRVVVRSRRKAIVLSDGAEFA